MSWLLIAKARSSAMPVPERHRLLILGGTGEAVELAREAQAAFGRCLDVVTSLAGRTRDPAPIQGEVRVGGFGGPDGLACYLEHHEFSLLIDATHPFAAEISANAREACARTKVHRLILSRPPWRRHPGDRWTEVDSVVQAATALASNGKRAFLTVGARDLHHFAALKGVFCLVRLITPPTSPLQLTDYTLVIGRGPFTCDEERRLMTTHRIDTVVSKASGGEATYAKIAAAREMEIPVILVRRPPSPKGEHVSGVSDALAWIANQLGVDRRFG
jgi:precorrin-6A/cobalt-precorrin-6A reductase